jgi:hypothetical protein
VAIRSRWTTIVQPTNAQVAADAYQAEHGRPAPGVTLDLLGWTWTAYDVVRMRVGASGREATEEDARAAAGRAIEALVDHDTAVVWMEETRHQRSGRVDMADLAAGDC